MLDPDKFRCAHESRHHSEEGVTLVAFYDEDKPRQLLDITAHINDGLTKALAGYPGLVRPYKHWLHATLCGLEGSKDKQGKIITENMKARASVTGERLSEFLVDEFLEFVVNYNWPITFRFGGCQRHDVNPYDEKRKPWNRTFELRGDGLAVLMGWPLHADSRPFGADLNDLRSSFHPFGIVHKYHRKRLDIDNDLFMVTAALDYEVWSSLPVKSQGDAEQQIQDYQHEVRTGFEKNTVTIKLSLEYIWVVKYRRTTLEQVDFAKRVTEVTAAEIRQLYE